MNTYQDLLLRERPVPLRRAGVVILCDGRIRRPQMSVSPRSKQRQLKGLCKGLCKGASPSGVSAKLLHGALYKPLNLPTKVMALLGLHPEKPGSAPWWEVSNCQYWLWEMASCSRAWRYPMLCGGE